MSLPRIAVVGTGGRALCFVETLLTRHRAARTLVALVDPSPTRLAYHNELITQRWHAAPVPTYAPEAFDRMITEQRPDTILVCSPDFTHDRYILAALAAGCDVITEKPMTIDAARCMAVLQAAQRSPRRVQVAFNYRWGVYRTKVKELLATGTIGRVHSVNLEYLLDTAHGADYFRRWHSEMASSGGLLVHKSTHHFDLVNWWLDAIPATVHAHGDLVYYGRENALRRGDGRWTEYPRTTGMATGDDPFALDLRETESFRRLYLAAEADSGYIRDRNVFRPGIDIYDQMSALVKYRTGEVLTYSLVAYSPREGMRVTFNGDRGRLEYYEFTGSHLNRAVTGSEFQNEQHGSAEAAGEWIRVFPHFAPSRLVELPPAHGPHGGADEVMFEHLFGTNPPPDSWDRPAGPEQGAASILVGIAANQSIATQRPVHLDALAPLPAAARRLRDLR